MLYYFVMKSSPNTAMAVFSALLFVIFVGSIGFLFYRSYIQQKRIEFVRCNSQLLKEIDKLNQKYHFYEYPEQYCHREILHSKSAYDKAQFQIILNEFALKNGNQLQKYIEYANINAKTYRMYCNEYEKLRQNNNYSASYYLNNAFFVEIEDQLCKERLKKPKKFFEIIIIKQYTSPQGRNHYEDHRIYTASQLEETIAKASAQMERQKAQFANHQAERAKMTESLRYTILKRDKGRCCLCGASAADGVKLHVDHIKPVSQGGKTEPSNLRTLCNRCNLGKGAKYDPNGYN